MIYPQVPGYVDVLARSCDAVGASRSVIWYFNLELEGTLKEN